MSEGFAQGLEGLIPHDGVHEWTFKTVTVVIDRVQAIRVDTWFGCYILHPFGYGRNICMQLRLDLLGCTPVERMFFHVRGPAIRSVHPVQLLLDHLVLHFHDLFLAILHIELALEIFVDVPVDVNLVQEPLRWRKHGILSLSE